MTLPPTIIVLASNVHRSLTYVMAAAATKETLTADLKMEGYFTPAVRFKWLLLWTVSINLRNSENSVRERWSLGHIKMRQY